MLIVIQIAKSSRFYFLSGFPFQSLYPVLLLHWQLGNNHYFHPELLDGNPNTCPTSSFPLWIFILFYFFYSSCLLQAYSTQNILVQKHLMALRRTQPGYVGILTQVINGCRFKLLNLWRFVAQKQKNDTLFKTWQLTSPRVSSPRDSKEVATVLFCGKTMNSLLVRSH